MTGSPGTAIVGTVYEDGNSNGMRDGGENGVQGWRVYLDLDQSGTFNRDAVGTLEPSSTTDVDGQFTINRLIPGVYRVAEELQAGWNPTAPASLDVVVVENRTTRDVNFFNFSGGDIVGTVWNDLSADGVRDAGEPGLAHWTVFLDADNNRVPDPGEPVTVTDDDGRYTFVGLPPGDYEVTEVLPEGWEVSPSFDTRQTAAVVARQQVSQDFANFSTTNGSIEGKIWNDQNGDGIRATDATSGAFTEPGLEGWTVFLDTNDNQSLDAGELSTTTDALGNYAFVSLAAGDYEVTEVLPAGWDVSPTFDIRQTVAVTGGALTLADDFANFTTLNGSIRGTIWNDLNQNSVRDVNPLTGDFSDPGLANWTVFLDRNRNHIADSGEPTAITDINGSYVFLDLQVADYEVQEVVPTGWETAPGFGDNYTVAVFSGTQSVAHDFANFNLAAVTPGSASGVVWNDLNGNGVRDVDLGTGSFTDPGLAGWTVYQDVNSDGSLQASEPQASSAADGTYRISGIAPGSVQIIVQPTAGWRPTAPLSGVRTISLKNSENASGLDFGEAELKDSSIGGTIFADANRNGTREVGEKGLSGLTVYLDINNNSQLDVGEPSQASSADLFYTPGVDEAGNYQFTHLARGSYSVRAVLPVELSATPAAEREHAVTIAAAEDRNNVSFAAVYRANEIHGVKFDDANGNHVRDAGEAGVGNATLFIDSNRNNQLDAGEPTTLTLDDGSYSFGDLTPGAYVIREVRVDGYTQTSPTTVGGILWPGGASHSAIGTVSPSEVTKSLAIGERYRQSVSITLPNSGALTNLVDVFLLFDDTGSFVNNSPIVRAAFPTIISQLQTTLPGIDLGFGVGRLEEYGNFAAEYATGRPFVLNQPVVAASSPGYLASIQAALNRTTPGYGGDQPETDIEALYQLVTGKGFDGNNNGSVLDSGPAGLASTQLNPGMSGDVPSFASFMADPTNSVLPASGNLGGAGFRAGALPIVLLATDTGIAYQPKGETTITGAAGLTLPISALTQTSRPTTPFNSGAGIQETITGLNALGALVIGLGTNPQANVDPRQMLESISKLTGATNQTTTTIANGTADPIAPGDPFYFQIASGFGASVANGVTSAIQNAVTNVAVDIDVRVSDPRVHLINHTGILSSVGAGETATFDVEFVGDGIPHRFDLQFVRAGSNVVLGSIPIVLGTPIPGDGYEFEDLPEGEIHSSVDFSDQFTGVSAANVAPTFTKGSDVTILEDAGAQSMVWATAVSPGPASEASQSVTFVVVNDNGPLFSVAPTIGSDGTLSFTAAADAYGTAMVTVQLRDDGGTANGGVDTSAPQTFVINVSSVNDAPVAIGDAYTTVENTILSVVTSGTLTNDTDVEGDSLTAMLVSGPSHGTVTLNADGSFLYTPNANYNGVDEFTYQANDGVANSTPATVSITVTAQNDAPVAVGDAYTTLEDSSVLIPATGVLANDTDVEGDSLTAMLVSGPSHGAVTLSADGSFIYTPNTNYNGVDEFTYQANDGFANSTPATVSIAVIAQNDAPVAVGDAYTTLEDNALLIPATGVLANDTDVEGDSLTAMLVSGPSHGAVTLSADGSFIYTPNTNYNGVDGFSYQANDGVADSAIAVVSIEIAAVNDPPIANPDSYAVDQGTTLTISGLLGVLENDTDVDGDSLTAVPVTAPSHGTLALGTDGSLSYTSAPGFVGTDSFTYLTSDGALTSVGAMVTIEVRQVTPPAGAKFFVVDDSARSMFGYGADGIHLNRQSLNLFDRQPRGIAASPDGSVRWVVDANGVVFVYDREGRLSGAWIARGLDHAEGIATNGRDLWIVDGDKDRVYFFANGAARRWGIAAASTSFALNKNNRNPTDVTTDGAHLWVVNDKSTVDRVFRYSISGSLEGDWALDPANSRPTGLTVDPQNVNHIWIVDSGTDRVYQYDAGTQRFSGSQRASTSFALADANRNPQGIADPPSQSSGLTTITEAAVAEFPAPVAKSRRFERTEPTSRGETVRSTPQTDSIERPSPRWLCDEAIQSIGQSPSQMPWDAREVINDLEKRHAVDQFFALSLDEIDWT